ncbi:MAG: sensor histidine kinase [Burkholderiaceae bacterium]
MQPTSCARRSALKLQLQLLERASDATQRDAALVELRTGVERAQHLVEQLLQLSRLAPETPALRRGPVDLAGLSRAAVSHFSARADAKCVDLGASAQGPVPIAGDAQQLAILLNNLIDNAVRHTPAGGRVDVTAGLFNGHPGVKVTDTGPGIAAAERHRVFDRFYRSPAAGSGGHEVHGSGLGLAIVKAVAERHAAQLSLDDAASGGLCVTVLFPSPES